MNIKKLVSVLLITSFIAVIAALPAFAYTIYFTAINNTLMELTSSTMPVNYGGTIYIPYSVFNSTELDTYAIYSSTSQTVIVFKGSSELLFNLKDSVTYDNDDNIYSSNAVYSNGQVYLPAKFTCDFFDIEYSVIRGNSYGTIIRMKVGSVLDDDTFSNAAEILMKSRLSEYLKSTSPDSSAPVSSDEPISSPSQSVQPSSSSQDHTYPGTIPDTTAEPTSSPQTQHNSTNVYLSFFGIDSENTLQILDTLSNYSYGACFFVSPEDISSYPDIIRRIVGSGCSLGIICGENYIADYRSAASSLYETAHTACFVISPASKPDSDFISEASSSGLITYHSVSEAVSAGSYRYKYALDHADSELDMLFTCDSKTVNTLPAILRKLKDENFSVKTLNEISASKYSA